MISFNICYRTTLTKFIVSIGYRNIHGYMTGLGKHIWAALARRSILLRTKHIIEIMHRYSQAETLTESVIQRAKIFIYFVMTFCLKGHSLNSNRQLLYLF